MAKNLLDMLQAGVVLGDGGMFLEANWRGYDVPEIVGTHSEALRQIHREWSFNCQKFHSMRQDVPRPGSNSLPFVPDISSRRAGENRCFPMNPFPASLLVPIGRALPPYPFAREILIQLES